MTESSIPMDRHKLCYSVCQQEVVCSRHKEPMKVYCRTDQQCICLLCLVDEHKGHDTVSAVTQRAEIQKSLGTAQANSRKTIQDTEKKLHDVRQAVESLKCTAKAAVEENERIFTDFIQSFERRCLEVKELIQDQGKAALGHAEGLQKRLEQDISNLRRRDAEIEQISNTVNDSHFLQRWKFLSTTPDLRGVSYEIPPLSFEPVNRAISELRDELEMICQRRFGRISETVSKLDEAAATPSKKHKARAEASPYGQELKDWQTGRDHGPPMSKVQIVESSALPPPPQPQSEPEQEPRTRAEFLRYACGLTLDPNTAHKNLHLSPGDREVTRVCERQRYPDNSERFDFKCQVLCREALRRRCYWEVEVHGRKAEIAVTYKGIMRKGNKLESSFGGNEKSWSLECINGEFSFSHNDCVFKLPAPYNHKVGVYIDHLAGTLSFYSISDTMTLIHKVDTVFTEPVYSGFWVGEQCTVKLVTPLLGASAQTVKTLES